MKKVINRNFIQAIIFTLAILLGYFGLGVYMNLSHMEFSEVHIDEPLVSSNYGAALRAIRESERIYYQKVYFEVAVVVIIYSLIHFLLAWKAWASCRANPEKWSDYSYKMVAPYVLQGLVIVSFIEMLIIEFHFILLVIALLALASLIYSVRNTFSKKVMADIKK